MRIIQFKENQKEVWNKFIAENNSESFLQSWEWGGFQKSLGRKIWRMAVVDNKKNLPAQGWSASGGEFETCLPVGKVWNIKNLVAVALIVKHDLPFEKSYLYCPRGPVVNESRIKNQESRVLNFMFNEIKKIAEKEKSLFLRIDPAIDRNLPAKGWSASGGESINLKKSSSEIQPKNTLMLDLEKSEEELLKKMKQKTRYNTRLAERKNINIEYWILDIKNKECFKEKFEEFWELTEETTKRDKFSSHSKNYYWKILESLGDNDVQAKLYLAEYENKTIAANIVLYFGDLAVYLHGASSNKYKNLMAPYLLQWRQVLDAKSAGCKKYDFWGIAGNNEKENWKGITRFKKGFGGYEKNYIGAYDLVFSNIGYAIYRFMKFVKSFVRTVF